jgi:thiol-disulfide isomerase/thioredoxin
MLPTSGSLLRAKAIHVVYANWCPHCVPTTLDKMKLAAKELGVPCLLYDIDTEQVRAADELVRQHGDSSPDYLIPQVFVEFEDGEVRHVLTGDPQGVKYTDAAVDNLLKGEMFRSLRARSPT